MVPGVVKFGPRVNTSEELAVSQYSGAEATAAARASYAGEIGLKQPSFANRFPEDALSLQPVPTLTQDQALRIPKNILYVVREDGSLVLSPRPSSGAYGHIDLASGGNVLAAGEGKILWGEVKSFDNASGHYLPQGAGARTAAEKAFSDYGFKVPASAYTEKIYDFGLGKWVKK